MLSGRRLDLLDPSPFDIEIEDVAHGLARVARWNGQTIGDQAFSVAQHSVIVEGIVAKLDPKTTPSDRLAALLHDAPEYVIGDMISPFKTALGFDYKDFEARLEAAVHLRFGLPAKPPRELKTLIKKADTVCAYFEATQLAGFSDAEARRYFGVPPRGMKLTLRPQTTMEAQQSFLDRFEELRARRDRSEAAIGRRARSF